MSALADTSAWIAAIRRRDERFFGAVEDGDVLGCPIVTLELLSGLRNARELREWRAMLGALTTVPVDALVTVRAEDVLERLADLRGGRHRDVPVADLLIAACAERHRVPLWHADRHFEQIARVTGQPQHRLTFDD